MIGRLSACLLAQIPRVRALLLHNFCLFGAGLSAMFVPLCQDYLTMCVTAFGYGLFMGEFCNKPMANQVFRKDENSSVVFSHFIVDEAVIT